MKYALDLRAETFSPLDRHFAKAVARRTPEAPPALETAAAIASRQVRRGHVCADFSRLALLSSEDAVTPVPWSKGDVEALLESLRSCSAVRIPADPKPTPLVLDGTRLYLDRYYEHEVGLARAIMARVGGEEAPVYTSLLEDGLARLFGASSRDQRDAAERAVRHRFFVLTGGPGTGKTSTVVKILALLLEQARQTDTSLAIDLLAPTGKAARRLLEAVTGAKAELACEASIKDGIPTEASTIHRRLGHRRGRVLHDAARPLHTDLVVVDEASMVDLLWMSRLFDALPSTARVLLLGDKDQLASVEAGAVLGDVCGAGLTPTNTKRPSPAPRPRKRDPRNQLSFFFREASAEPTPGTATIPEPPIAGCIAELTTSYRYAGGSGIAALARAVWEGDEASVFSILRDGHDDVIDLKPHSRGLSANLIALAVERYARYLAAEEPSARLSSLDEFRILCAHRRGPGGVETINGAVERALHHAGHLRQLGPRHYPGRPLLVQHNDYELGLFNGDVGTVLQVEGQLRAAFAAGPDALRFIAPARLESVDTLFAMSIHKSQGSEMNEVAIVLPPKPSPLLTRELLYTAVTRAKKRVFLSASDEVLRVALRQRVERASGLRERLWGR